jgi:hypothetical protein
MSATMTSAEANPSPSATHARSSNQPGATRNHYTIYVGRGSELWSLYGALWSQPVANGGKCCCARNRQNKRKSVAVNCHRMRCRIWADNRPEGGARVAFTLQAAPTRPLAEVAAD